MRLRITILAVFLALPISLPAAETANQNPASDNRPAGEPGRDRGDRESRREGWLARMAEEHPELKGVDLNSPEGQEKVREVMQKRMEKEAPRIRERIAERQAQDFSELQKKFALTPEEFTAIQPLIARVENLMSQRNLVDPAARAGSPFGRDRGRGDGPMLNPQLLLGDAQMEPTVQEIEAATKVLKALTKDAQANESEIAAALARLRKAREAFSTVLKNAQGELRSVLTPRQEALMVERGSLD
jgi:NADH dehydrogenase/NADH:ubiquinone oxidoreductase subunit G